MTKDTTVLDSGLKARLADLQKKIYQDRLSQFSNRRAREPRTYEISKVSYNLPSFESDRLNYALNIIISVITDVRKDFADGFVTKKANKSLGYVKKLREEATGIFDPLRERILVANNDGNGGSNLESQKEAVRESKRHFSKWFAAEILSLSSDGQDTERSINAFNQLFQSCNIIYQEVDEDITVNEEMERFISSYLDSRYIKTGKLLKRIRFKVRRLFGSDYVPKRVLHMRNLVKYNFGGMLPPKFRKAANMVGYETFFLISKLRMLHQSFNVFYDELLEFLDQQEHRLSSGTPFDRERLYELFAFYQKGFEEDLNFVLSEIGKYRDDTNTEINAGFAAVYNKLIKMIKIAGTFELPEKKFRFSSVYEDSEKAKGEVFGTLRLWNRYSVGLAGTYAVDLELIEIQSKIRFLVDSALIDLSGTIKKNLKDALVATRDIASDIYDKVQDLYGRQPQAEEVTTRLEKEKNRIVDFIKNDLLIRLEELNNNETITRVIDNLLFEFSNLTDEMADEYHVLDTDELDIDEGLTPFPIELKSIPLRQVTKSYFEIEATRDLNDVNRMIFDETNTTVNAMIDIWRMINFNTESGIKEIEAFLGEKRIGSEQLAVSLEVVSGGLKRSVTKIDEILEQLEFLEEQTRKRIISVVAENSRHLKGLVAEKTVHEIREHVKQREMEAESGRVLHSVSRKFQRLTGYFRKAIRSIAETIEVDLVDIKTRLGFRKVSHTEIIETYDKVKIDDNIIQHLPFIYRRLFHIESSEAGEFLVGREEEIALVKQTKERWRKGLYAATVTIGESGSGKTSFMNYLQKNLFQNEKLIRHKFIRTISGSQDLLTVIARLFNVRGAKSFEELQNRILKSAEKSAVILESMQNLFIRDIGGFEALREFLVFVEATGHQVLWICSMNAHAWNYLDGVMDISEFFTYVVEMKNLSSDDLKKAILSRHKLSGFDLHFSPSDEIQTKNKYRKAKSEPERQEVLEDAFFDQIYETSQGNPQAALYYWVKSIRGFEQNSVYMNPLPKLSFSFLKDFHLDKLFTLKALIQHGGLTIREHSQIFKLEQIESKRILSYLLNANLISNTKRIYREDNFVINKSVYIPIAEELRARNLLD